MPASDAIAYIRTFEIDLGGPLRLEIEMLFGIAQEIRDHRKLGLVLGLILLLHGRIARTLRPGILRRLFEHVVGQHDRLARAAFGDTHLTLLADARPIRHGDRFMPGARGGAFL